MNPPPRVNAASPSISEPNSLEDVSFTSTQDEDTNVSPSASTPTSIYSHRQNKRRRWSHRFSPTSDSEFHIPQKVSAWKLFHAERLHIYYSKSYAESPIDLFSLLNKTIQPYTDQQKQYIERIKSILKFDSGPRGPWSRATVYHEAYNRLNDELDGIIKELRSLYTNGNNLDALVSHRIHVFVLELVTLLKTFQNKIGEGKDVNLVSEAHYIPVCESFAVMCNLTVQSCRLQSKWFKLADQSVVSSIPDLRFYQKGKNFDEFIIPTSRILVSVVEVKKDSQQRSEEPPIKQIRCSGEINEDNNKPEILKDLGVSVLGQHAGELLLEIRQNHVKKEENGVGKYMLPGMIIDGTKVFFTLLEMTTDHLDALRTQTEYKSDMDNATIHYVKPLDLIFKEERNILVDSFVMLNNIDFSSLRG